MPTPSLHPPAVTLRRAGPADAPAAAAVQLEAALTGFAHIFPPEAPAPTQASLTGEWEERLAAGEGWAGFLAEVPVAVPSAVGVVFAGPDPDGPAAVGHISGLYVRPAHWAHGIGRRLYDRALAHLAGLGMTEATLWVLEHNTRARRWYERLGWTLDGRVKPTFAPAGVVDVGYRRTLDGLPGRPG